MASLSLAGKLTYAEYLELERGSSLKHEYRAGELFAMSGGTPVHARLSVRISTLLETSLGGHCQVFSSDLRVYAVAVQEGMYPDVSVVCGDLEFFDGRKDVILNPSLVVEVLSPSSREYDLSMKASFYRAIPSVQAILFVDSERRYLQQQVREGEGWTLAEFSCGDSGVAIWESTAISVAAVYDGI